MEVRLTPEQARVIEEAVAAGRCASAEDAIREALVLWEENARKLAELRALIDEADSHASEDTEYTDETLADLFVELRREARASLDAEQIEKI